MTAELSFTLNGRPVAATILPDERLLSVLRDRLGVTDITDGCSPQGQCGCCTVWVDGSPRVACATPAARVAGRAVTTPSGLPHELSTALAGAFATTGASQCGFCSPGIVMRLAAHLRHKPDLTDAEIDRALAAHICRCTGWEQIRAATRRAGEVLRGERAPDPTPAESLALGARAYVDDRRPPRCWSVVLILAPGPGRLTSPIVAPEGTEVVAITDSARHDGTALALLAARDRPTVRTALASLEIEWAPGPPRPASELFLEPAHPAFLEPEAVVIEQDGTVISASERPLPGWVSVPDGGSFGGKRQHWVEELALAAHRALGGAVALALSREESIRCGPTRHGALGHIARDGDRLTGNITFVAGEHSWCRDDVMGMAEWCLPGPYALSSDVRVDLITTSGPSSGWMRGEGSVAPVTLRELALGEGVAPRMQLLPEGRVKNALAAMLEWLEGEEPPGIAVHVGRLPATDDITATWSGSVLTHPFDPIGDFPVEQHALRQRGPCPRGGGWPFVLISLADGATPNGPGPAVATARTSDGLKVVVDAGRIIDPVMAEGHARGGAHMGLGAALSERVVREGGVTKSVTIRSLGVVPAAATPPMDVRFVGDGPALAGVAEACVAPVAAAVLLAAGGRTMPALDTVASRTVRRQR